MAMWMGVWLGVWLDMDFPLVGIIDTGNRE